MRPAYNQKISSARTLKPTTQNRATILYRSECSAGFAQQPAPPNRYGKCNAGQMTFGGSHHRGRGLDLPISAQIVVAIGLAALQNPGIEL
jgi:hypothetical protein